MKKTKIKQIVLFLIIFTLSALFIFGEGFYRKALAKESNTINITLLSKDIKPIVVDIANEGLPKRLVQPGYFTISSGHGVGVFNKGKEELLVQVKATGFSTEVVVDSSTVSFEKETGKFLKAVKPGSGVAITLTFDIARSEIEKNSVTSGNLEFTDYKSGAVLATVPIKVINSKVSESK